MKQKSDGPRTLFEARRLIGNRVASLIEYEIGALSSHDMHYPDTWTETQRKRYERALNEIIAMCMGFGSRGNR